MSEIFANGMLAVKSIIDEAISQTDPPRWNVVISDENMHSIRLLVKEFSAKSFAGQPAAAPLDQSAAPPSQPGPVVSVGSVEANFAPASAPVSNERGPAVIYGNHGSRLRHPNLPPPPTPLQSNKDVALGAAGPPPIQNDPKHTATRATQPEPTVSVGSVEANFAPASNPISNERGAGTIYGNHGSRLRHANLPPPPTPAQTNKEVTMGTAGPAPIQNDPIRTINGSKTDSEEGESHG